MTIDHHPDAAALAAFANGRLTDAHHAVVAAHLAGCDACRRLAAGQPADSFARKLRKPDKRSTVSDGVTGLSQMLQNLTDLPAAAVPPELASLTQYADLRELGRGGMGVVYLARNTLLDRFEVLKVANRGVLERAGPGAAERFLQEMRAAARLQNKYVVAAYAAYQQGDTLVFAMEYAAGEDLAKLIDRKGPLPVPAACFYAYCAALGLQHAHEKGMTHRDIKPGNLMLTKVDGKPAVKVLDFGLAKVARGADASEGLTAANQLMGTPAYIAPEQAVDAATADTRADVYSLGCTLYCLLTGKPPFSGVGGWMAVVDAHRHTPPRPVGEVRPDVPAELSDAVAKMLAKRPADRFQTPGEVAAVLKGFVTRKPAAEAETNRGGRTVTVPPRRKRWGAKVWAMLAVGLALNVVGGLLLYQVVFRAKTPHGTIVLEGVPADATVELDGATATVSRAGETLTLTAVPGPHALKVVQGGKELRVAGEAVVVVGGQEVRVRVEPAAPAQRPATPSPAGKPEVAPTPAPSVGLGPVVSRFAAGAADGWTVRQGEELTSQTDPARVVEKDGHWAIRGDDIVRRQNWGWHAPAKYHGDQSRQFGRELIFRIWPSHVAVATDPKSVSQHFRRAIILSGAGKTLTLDNPMPRPVAGQWLTRRVRIDASGGWVVVGGKSGDHPATDADLKGVLASVTDLRIRGEFSDEVDHGFLADVQFGAEPPAAVVQPPPEVGFTPLFNGRDLAGWARPDGAADEWKVVEGVLTARGPANHTTLFTRDQYADFHLRAECRVNDGGNGGLLFRSQAVNRFGIPGYEAEVLFSKLTKMEELRETGSLLFNGRLLTRPTKPAGRPGQWLRYEVRAVGPRVTLTVNGVQTVEHADPDATHPRGFIGLQKLGAGTVAEYRNIELRPLTPAGAAAPPPTPPAPTVAPPPAPAPAQSPEVGFAPLFNGKDMAGWKVDVPEQKAGWWSVQDGALVGRKPADGTAYSYILADGTYADFALRFDFQLAGPKAHGAVALRATPGERSPMRVGGSQNQHPRLELGWAGRTAVTGSPYFLTALFAGPAPADPPAVEAGRWHAAEVVVHGDICTAAIDGKPAVGLVAAPPEAGATTGKFTPGLLRKAGRVGFQVLADSVRFREVRVKRLDGTPPPPRPAPPAKPVVERPDPAAEVTPVVSRFAAGDADGWRATKTHAKGKVRTLDVRAAGNDHWLYSVGKNDPADTYEWGWQAPAKFHGDQADKYGRRLTFRVWEEKPAKRGANTTCVWLMGAGEGELFVRESAVRRVPTAGWTTFSIPLDPTGGWTKRLGGKATEAEILAVLADVKSLWLGMGGTGDAAGGLDDVVLGADK